MTKIKSKISDGTVKAQICHIDQKPYLSGKGLSFYVDGTDAEGKKVEVSVSPAAAHRIGFEVSDIAPPPSVRSKSDLSNWLSDLGLKNESSNYRKLYKDYAGMFQFHEIRDGVGYH